jgi:uncharacterized protein (TIRG00374 family)
MKKFLLFLLSLFSGAVLFYAVIKFVGWQEIEKSFRLFRGWQGASILGLTVMAALAGIWKWQEILKGLGVEIHFSSLWSPYLAGFAIRYLAPVILIGGEIFQSHALRDIHSVKWEKSMASVILDRILDLTCSLLVIFFGVLFFLIKIGLPPLKLELIFGSLIFLVTALTAYFYFKSVRRESMIKAVARIFNGKMDSHPLEVEKEIFNFFRSGSKTMWKSFILAILRIAILWLRTWLLVLFLGKGLGALASLSILGFYCLVLMIPIPADIGSHEAIQAFAFSSLGLSAGAGTAFALIVRGAELMLALFGVIILFRLGVELLKNTLFKKTEGLARRLETNQISPVSRSGLLMRPTRHKI